MKYHNPIIPGFHPDPSVCRVGDTYYLVTSSFNYFPGVPLFESKDLLNWHQIGHVLNRKEQLPLATSSTSGGIYAPTIRYHQGRFYMVTTNVDHGGNFFVWTDDIHGAWSDPIWVDQDGIDPSFYFEGDHAYFMSNGTDDDGVNGIVQCELDLTIGRKLSPTRCIWQGNGGRYLEGPHLYQIGKTYYLLASEGGTEYGHMMVMAKSDQLAGPYLSDPHNPILTNRDLGGYQIQGCGHADLVDDPQGNWWLIHLAFRQLDQYIQHHITGREVYLVPATFDESGWLQAGDQGTTRAEMTGPGQALQQDQHRRFDFTNTTIGQEWVYLRNPELANYRVDQPTWQLRGNEVTLADPQTSPTALFVRQDELDFNYAVTLTSAAQEAGITVYMSENQHYELLLRPTDHGIELLRRLSLGDLVQEDHQTILGPNAQPQQVRLTVTGSNYHYGFSATVAGKQYDLGQAQTKYLSSEVAGNFTGVMLGLFAQKPAATSVWSTFSDWRYQY